MATLKIILTVIFVLLGVAISAIILMQEGKSAGLGAISGVAESYGLKYPALIEKRPMINTLGDKGVFALSGYAKRETDGRF